MKSFISTFKNLSFKGRVSPGAYWKFVGIIILIYVLLFMIPIFVGVYFNIDTVLFTYAALTAYTLITFLPAFTMQVKRLHDINKSGMWILLCLIPFIGCIILLVLLCKDGDKTANNYGEPPLNSIADISNIKN